MNKTIWICWFQGEHDEHMPRINKLSVGRWRKLNPDYQVIFLSNENIVYFAPEFEDIVRQSPERSYASKSDLLRILLLSKYGGTWVDSSVYPMLPLNEFYDKIMNDSGFFAYRHLEHPEVITTSSWFLTTPEPKHHLIETWKLAFVERFKSGPVWDPKPTGPASSYFTFHHTLTDLYKNVNTVRDTIDSMVQHNQLIPHTAMWFGWGNKSPSFMYKRPTLTSNMFKQLEASLKQS